MYAIIYSGRSVSSTIHPGIHILPPHQSWNYIPSLTKPGNLSPSRPGRSIIYPSHPTRHVSSPSHIWSNLSLSISGSSNHHPTSQGTSCHLITSFPGVPVLSTFYRGTNGSSPSHHGIIILFLSHPGSINPAYRPSAGSIPPQCHPWRKTPSPRHTRINISSPGSSDIHFPTPPS